MELKESLEKCYKIWDWMARHPKCNVKLDAYKALGIKEEDLRYCPCCEYSDSLQSGCDNCPMQGLWNFDSIFCNYTKSPYYKWNHSIADRDRAHYARIIADHAKSELERLF